MIIITDFDLINHKAEGYVKETKLFKKFIIKIENNEIKFFDIQEKRILRFFEWIFENYKENLTFRD